MADNITWESLDNQLADDCDLINVAIEQNAVDAQEVEFVLESSPDVTAWKGIKVPDGQGSDWQIATEGGKKSDRVSLWAQQVHNGQVLDLRKGKFLGIHTTVYKLGGLDRLLPGSRVTFRWVQDSCPGRRARFVSQTVPTPMQAGQSYDVSVTMKNTGDRAWTAEARHRLGSQSPQENTTWGPHRVQVPHRVEEKGEVTFQFRVTAPATPGQHAFQWRMLQEGAAWFGDLTPSVAVQVEAAAPPAPPQLMATPTISAAADACTGAVTLTLATATPSAQIFYTTDSSEPTSGSTPYAAPIVLASEPPRTVTLKARAFQNGVPESALAAQDFALAPAQAAWPGKCLASGQAYRPPQPVGRAPVPTFDLSNEPSTTDPAHASRIRYVAAARSQAEVNSGDGSAANPWRSLRRAVRSLQPGQKAVVRAGEYRLDWEDNQSRVEIAAEQSGDAANPIWLSAEPGAVLKDLTSVTTTPFIRVNASFWVIEGFEIDGSRQQAPGRSEGNAIRVQNASNVVVRRIHAHNGRGPSAVQILDSSNVAVQNCRIHNYDRLPDAQGKPQDSHGIHIVGTSHSILIEGNTSSGHGGDSLQIAALSDNPSDLEPDPGTFPRDITIVGNTFHGDGENAVDIKTSDTVTVRDNTFFDYKPVSTSSGGDAIVVHRYANNVLIEGNRISRCGRGASIGSSRDNNGVDTVVFRGNVVFKMLASLGPGGTAPGTGSGLRAGDVKRIEIYNNTFYDLGRLREDGSTPATPTANSCYGITLGDDDGPIERAVVLNNIIAVAGHALNIKTATVPTLCSDRNLFYQADSFSQGKPVLRDGVAISLADWKATYGYDCSSLDGEGANPQFVGAEAEDFNTNTGPARDQGAIVCPPFRPAQGAAPDIGGLESGGVASGPRVSSLSASRSADPGPRASGLRALESSASQARERLAKPARRLARPATVALATALALGVARYLKKRG